MIYVRVLYAADILLFSLICFLHIAETSEWTKLSSHKLTESELKKYLAEINILTYPLKILVPIPHNKYE